MALVLKAVADATKVSGRSGEHTTGAHESATLRRILRTSVAHLRSYLEDECGNLYTSPVLSKIRPGIYGCSSMKIDTWVVHPAAPKSD